MTKGTRRARQRLQATLGAIALLLACASSGRVASDDQSRLAAEFLASEPSARTLRGWKDDVRPDATIRDELEREASSRNKRLLASAFLVTGFHPYWGATFIEAGNGVEIAVTLLYWGRVDGKWRTRVPREAFDAFLRNSEAILECEPGPPPPHWRLDGAALFEESPQRGSRSCTAEWASEGAEEFGELMLELTKGEVTTYERH